MQLLSMLKHDRWAKLSQKACFLWVMYCYGKNWALEAWWLYLREYICNLFRRVGGSSLASSTSLFYIILWLRYVSLPCLYSGSAVFGLKMLRTIFQAASQDTQYWIWQMCHGDSKDQIILEKTETFKVRDVPCLCSATPSFWPLGSSTKAHWSDIPLVPQYTHQP